MFRFPHAVFRLAGRCVYRMMCFGVPDDVFRCSLSGCCQAYGWPHGGDRFLPQPNYQTINRRDHGYWKEPTALPSPSKSSRPRVLRTSSACDSMCMLLRETRLAAQVRGEGMPLRDVALLSLGVVLWQVAQSLPVPRIHQVSVTCTSRWKPVSEILRVHWGALG